MRSSCILVGLNSHCYLIRRRIKKLILRTCFWNLVVINNKYAYICTYIIKFKKIKKKLAHITNTAMTRDYVDFQFLLKCKSCSTKFKKWYFSETCRNIFLHHKSSAFDKRLDKETIRYINFLRQEFLDEKFWCYYI